MTASAATVLVVDDDPILLETFTLYLQEAGFQVRRADDGAKALELLRSEPAVVDVIVSDVNMPVMDGYALCQQVKSDEAISNIPLIFVSALTDLEEKLKGYAVGGDDYIVKPVAPEEMLEKVKNLSKWREKERASSRELQESFNAAMQAMTYSSDLGQILEFYKNSFAARNFEELAGLIFQTMAAYGLRSTLYITLPDSTLVKGDEGKVSPLEVNVIELARQKGRFYDFGARTIINYDDFSLLIKNMPVADAERYGVVKDVLGTLCNAIEARISSLIVNDINQHKARILETVQRSFNDVGQAFSDIQKLNIKAIEDMIEQLDEEIMTLGLTEEQENRIRDIAVRCRDTVDEIFRDGSVIQEEFVELIRQMSTLFNIGK